MVALVWDMPSHSMVVLPIKLPSRGRGTPRREAWVTVTVSAPSGVTEGSRVRVTSQARTWPVAVMVPGLEAVPTVPAVMSALGKSVLVRARRPTSSQDSVPSTLSLLAG